MPHATTTTAAACRWKFCARNGATSPALTRVDQKLEHRDFAVVVGASCGGVEAMQKLGMAETKNS
jgi:chemotaxis response regulator CheB